MHSSFIVLLLPLSLFLAVRGISIPDISIGDYLVEVQQQNLTNDPLSFILYCNLSTVPEYQPTILAVGELAKGPSSWDTVFSAGYLNVLGIQLRLSTESDDFLIGPIEASNGTYWMAHVGPNYLLSLVPNTEPIDPLDAAVQIAVTYDKSIEFNSFSLFLDLIEWSTQLAIGTVTLGSQPLNIPPFTLFTLLPSHVDQSWVGKPVSSLTDYGAPFTFPIEYSTNEIGYHGIVTRWPNNFDYSFTMSYLWHN